MTATQTATRWAIALALFAAFVALLVLTTRHGAHITAGAHYHS